MGINTCSIPTSKQCLSLVPILPSGYDRFVSPAPRKLRNEEDLRTRAAWILVDRPESSRQVHPEGGVYFYSGHVVSDSIITGELQVLGGQLIQEYQTSSNDSNITVFLKESDNGIQYYFANHSTKAICWLNRERPEDMNEVAHNRVANILIQEYWNHMENFPAPMFINEADLRLLQNVLAGLAVDASTSDGSTSPFSAAQIAQFLQILDAFTGNPDEFQTYTIARLWSMIWYTRLVNNYGTAEACLDRFTAMADSPPAFTNINILLARIMFSFGPQNHLMRCSRAWCGRIAYVTEWRAFKTKNESEWKQVIDLSCVLALASLIVRGQNAFSIVNFISLALACTAAASGYYLMNDSQNLGEQAADASTYFQKWELPEYNVQNIALRNAAPQALLIWGFVIFILSLVFCP